jgi:hypothetical protein
MKFVEDWKQSYKWLSVHIATLMAVLNAAQATVPQIQGFLTHSQLAVTNAVLGVLVIWGRLIQQEAQ